MAGHPRVLVEDANDRSPLRLEMGSGCDDVQVGDLVVVKTTDADFPVRVDSDDTRVVTRKSPPISTSVDESAI
jgi:hypothetical protein